MSNAATAQVVSLDEYRRARSSERRGGPMTVAPAQHAAPSIPTAPAVWVYWVPVWVW